MKSVLMSIFMSCALISLFQVSCTTESNALENTEKESELTNNKQPYKNGEELIDNMVEKISNRGSLSKDEEKKVRKIFSDYFEKNHGKITDDMPFKDLKNIRKKMFYESKDSLQKYIKGNKVTE